ncbi:unnamed protein product [Brachionus calyciflorus]|uniref:Retrotransposon gag domain-containing protein n=1 Tax=Brachionus calyciflorus TaxID=104777 RepID=A0A814LD50_9BILA|nr:unnamed protein product [Brachionus calyciflorus]
MEHRSWKDYETTLRKTFSKAHKSDKFTTELINLKHKDNSTIEAYNMKFLKLTFHLESMCEEDKFFYYMNGLKDRTRRELKIRAVKDLDNAMAIATNLEQDFDSIQNVNYTKTRNNDKKFFVNRNINKTTNFNNKPFEKPLINGIELTVGFDSGATVSVLSHEIAVKNNIEILPSDCKVKTATGLITKLSGKTSPLEVIINNHSCMIEFVVFDHEDNDVLLDYDWFCKTKCGIYPYKTMLSFPEDKIYLNEDIKELDRNDTADMFLSELNVDEVELEEENFWDMSDKKLEPASKLNSKELIHFDKLKYSASKMFANEIDELGACSIMEDKIRIGVTINCH